MAAKIPDCFGKWEQEACAACAINDQCLTELAQQMGKLLAVDEALTKKELAVNLKVSVESVEMAKRLSLPTETIPVEEAPVEKKKDKTPVASTEAVEPPVEPKKHRGRQKGTKNKNKNKDLQAVVPPERAKDLPEVPEAPLSNGRVCGTCLGTGLASGKQVCKTCEGTGIKGQAVLEFKKLEKEIPSGTETVPGNVGSDPGGNATPSVEGPVVHGDSAGRRVPISGDKVSHSVCGNGGSAGVISAQDGKDRKGEIPKDTLQAPAILEEGITTGTGAIIDLLKVRQIVGVTFYSNILHQMVTLTCERGIAAGSKEVTLGELSRILELVKCGFTPEEAISRVVV